jgi:nitrite reductase/ring-hydroxylating ferredoxin subunit
MGRTDVSRRDLLVGGGVVTCPGHFAHYRSADGSLIDGPSPRGLRPVPVQVVNGKVLRVRG